MVDVVYDNSPAVSAGLQEGDKIIKVNNQKITFYRDYSFYRVYHADDTMNITYEREVPDGCYFRAEWDNSRRI